MRNYLRKVNPYSIDCLNSEHSSTSPSDRVNVRSDSVLYIVFVNLIDDSATSTPKPTVSSHTTTEVDVHPLTTISTSTEVNATTVLDATTGQCTIKLKFQVDKYL